MNKKIEQTPKGLYKVGKIWYANWVDPNGKQIRRSTGTEELKMARKFLELRHAEKFLGKNPEFKDDTKLTLKEFIEDKFIPLHVDSLKSHQFYKCVLSKLEERMGHLRMSQIRPDLVQQYKIERMKDDAWGRSLERKVSKTTVQRELAVLRCVFNKAVEWGDLRFAPIGRIRLEREPRRERVYSDDEIARLLGAASEPMRSFILLAINTGMRAQEVLALRWSEVDMAARSITLTASRTKTQRSRNIPINEAVYNMLSTQESRLQGSPYVFPNPRTGKPNRWISHTWPALLKKAKVAPGTFHGLRHTWITRAVAAGVPLPTVQSISGHSTLAALQVYAHALQSSKIDAVTRVQFQHTPAEVTIISEGIKGGA